MWEDSHWLHLKSFNSSSFISVSWILLIRPMILWSYLCRNMTSCWHFTIIKSLQHIRTGLWQQKVILKHSTISTHYLAVYLLMIALFLSFEIHILHKSWLGVIHVIWRSQFTTWIIEPATCRIMLLGAIIRRI